MRLPAFRLHKCLQNAFFEVLYLRRLILARVQRIVLFLAKLAAVEEGAQIKFTLGSLEFFFLSRVFSPCLL